MTPEKDVIVHKVSIHIYRNTH